VNIDSSGGAISIGADDIDQAVNLGTTGTRTITVGSSAATIAVMSGAGDITLTTHTGGHVLIPNGNLGLQQSAPTVAFQIGSSGDGTLALSNGWTSFSDRRLKKHIVNITDTMIERVMQLRPVTFAWKSSGAPDVGFIAQEVEQLLPMLVTTNNISGIKAIDYPKLGVYLAKALQDQGKRLDELELRSEDRERIHKMELMVNETRSLVVTMQSASDAQIQAQSKQIAELTKHKKHTATQFLAMKQNVEAHTKVSNAIEARLMSEIKAQRQEMIEMRLQMKHLIASLPTKHEEGGK